jgi:hypothetical protein
MNLANNFVYPTKDQFRDRCIILYGIQVQHKVKTKQFEVTESKDRYSELKNKIGTFVC